MKDLYLSGGSFYGIQEVFSRVKGVVDTKAGYANSSMENPTKDDVDKGLAGAVECVKEDRYCIPARPVFHHHKSLYRRDSGKIQGSAVQERHLLYVSGRYHPDQLLHGLYGK